MCRSNVSACASEAWSFRVEDVRFAGGPKVSETFAKSGKEESETYKGKCGGRQLQVSLVDIKRAFFYAAVTGDQPIFVELPPRIFRVWKTVRKAATPPVRHQGRSRRMGGGVLRIPAGNWIHKGAGKWMLVLPPGPEFEGGSVR